MRHPGRRGDAGVVELVTDDPEAGPWLIKVHWADKGVTTSYAHVQNPVGHRRATVLAGALLAEVGDLGAVDRCALGLSMSARTDGKTRNIDPLKWLTNNGAAVDDAADPDRQDTTFRVASFNVLGPHLTAPGGGRPGFAPGTTRVADGLARVEGSEASIVVFNEFESPQASVVLGDGDWDAAPGHAQQHVPRRQRQRQRDRLAQGHLEARRVDRVHRAVAGHAAHAGGPLEHVSTGAQIIVIGVHNPASTAVKGQPVGLAPWPARSSWPTSPSCARADPGVPVIIAAT